MLVVDAFEDSRSGEVNRKAFRQCVLDCISRCGLADPLLIQRRMNKLDDYCIDWEHDLMDAVTKRRAKTFDKLDMVIVGGDIGVMSWNPLCMQLVTLCNMANKVNKPIMCLGAAAFTYIYALSTCGLRFNVLNQPLGGLIRDLPRFDHYTVAGENTAYPGGYLGNEIGDLYTYDPDRRAWMPRCNVGVHYSGGAAVSGLPMPPRNFVSRERRAEPTLLTDSSIANVRASKQQHYSLKHIGHNFFPYTHLKDWLINNEGGLPAVTSSSLQIVAESYSGPVLLAKGNAVLLASVVTDSGPSREASFKLMLGWMGDILGRLKVNTSARIDESIYDFLFKNVSSKPGAAFSIDTTGDRPLAKNSYETLKEREFYTCSPALTSVSYRSALPGGPRLLVTPVFSLYFPQVLDNTIDYDALRKRAKHAQQPRSVGLVSSTNVPSQAGIHGAPGIVLIVRNPAMQTDIRVKDILSKGGYANTVKVWNQVKELDKRNGGDCAADPALRGKDKELLAGRFMDSHNVFPRKGRSLAAYGVYEDLKVVSPDAAADDIRSVFSDDKTVATGISRMKVGVNVNFSKQQNRTKVKDIELGKNIKGMYDAATGKILRISSNNNINVKFAIDDSAVGALEGGPDRLGLGLGLFADDALGLGLFADDASTTRPKSALLSKMTQEYFLPLSKPTPESQSYSGLDKIAHSNNAFPKDVVRLDSADKPSYFFNSIDRRGGENDYKGYYQDGIVFKTPFEFAMMQEVARNANLLAGPFKTHHGKASTMGVRQEGGVRPHSAYKDPENPQKEVSKIPGASNKKIFGSWK